MVICIDCPTLIIKGSGSKRCLPCRQAHNRRKNNTPAAIARRQNRTPGLVGTCVCCGIHGPMTKDHIISLVRGGTNHPSNIQLMCLPCNASKGSGTECHLHASDGT